MRRLSKKLSYAFVLAVIALGFSLPSHAQISLSGFAIGALPNPVGDDFYTTITGVVFGPAGVPAPDGQIDFFISGDPTDCNNYQTDLGTGTVDSSGEASISFYAYYSGALPICGNYTSSESGYAPATAGPFVLTVYAPTTILVYVPGASVQGGTVTFNVVLTTPSGQPAPTGSISIEDPLNGNTVVGGPTQVGTITVNGQQVAGATISTNLLSGNEYLAVYSGDGNYSSEGAQGTIFLENPLTSITPASFIANSPITSPNTACQLATGAPGLQVTLTGIGFNADTTAQILIGGSYQTLEGNPSGTTQFIGCIPTSALTTPTTLYVETYTAGQQGGPVAFQVYAPFAINTTVSSTPSTFAYGTNLASIINGTGTRTAATDAAVPAGTVTFDLTGTAPVSPTVTLGTAQFTQGTGLGTYQNPLQAPFDTNSTQKMISADLNGDGFVDVVGMPGSYPGSSAIAPYLQIFLSTGSNTFQTEQQVYSGCAAEDFAVGDINGDTIPDLVVVCPGVSTPGFSNPLQAYYMLGNGDGTFQAPVQFGDGSFVSSPTQVVLGWFNDDGFNNVAVIDGIDGYLQIISPFGANNCVSPSYSCDNYVYFDTGFGQVFSAGSADFNQDGLTDIVLAEYSYNNGGGAILPLMNSSFGNGFNALNPTQFPAEANFMTSMTVADVNGDGYPDIAIADPGVPDGNDSGNVLIFENDETGNLPLTLSYPLTSVGSVAGAPFPLVGAPSTNAAIAPGWNLVYSAYGNSDGDTFVGELQRQNASTWTQVGSPVDTGTYPFGTEGGPIPGFIVTGDLNGDGYLDFAATGLISDDGAPSGSLMELLPYYYGNDALVTLSSSSQLPTPGTYSLSMLYPGNLLYQANNTATSTVTISKGTVTGGVSGPGTVSYGAAFTLTATITGVPGGALPHGKVTFFDGATQLGSPVTLVAGTGDSTASLNVTQTLTAGAHTINISYAGNADYLAAPSIANTPLQVNGQTVTLSLTTSASSGTTAGAMVNFQAQAVGVTLPAGETIYLSGLPLANNPAVTINSSGIASFNYGALAPGTYNVWAYYFGDSVYASAQTGYTTFTVNPTPVTVNLTSSANPVTYPTAVNLTANATSGGLGVPTGSIAFDDNGGLLSSVSLSTINGSSGLLTGNTYANQGPSNIVTVTGDFNHDGNQDIATLQQNGANVSTLNIMLGNGDGTFQTPIVYGTTSGTTAIDTTANSMAAADLTGTGYSDSLVIGASDGTVAVLLYNAGNTAGILQSSQNLTYAGTVGVGIGDFTKNGQQDIAVISGASVAAFYNNGNGTFPTTPSWSANSPYMYSDFTGVAVADYNQDGYADIAISDDSGSAGPDVTLFLYSPGSSTFSAPVTYPVGVSATGIASGKLNNDAYPDLAVLSSEDSTVDVLINNLSGGFPSGTSYGVAPTPTGIAIADFNGDTFADIAVSGYGVGAGSGTSILLSSSNGLMVGESLLATTNATSVAAGDFNGDGNSDLAVGSSGVTIFLDSSAQIVDSGVALTAGTHPLTAVYTPAVGGTFAAGTSSILSQVVNQDVPVVTWANPAAINYGTPLTTLQLDAVPPAGIPGTLTYNPGAGTVLTAGTHQLAVTFDPTDAVDYQSVTEFATIIVNQSATTVTWNPPAGITYGTALSATQLDATASVPGTFAYDPAAGTVLTAGTHTLAVTFTPTDSVDYQAATGSVSITVAKATPTITWAAPAGITYGTALSATQLDATGSVPGVFTYTPAAGTVLTAGTHTLSVTLSPTDGTDYAAVTKTASIVVGQATTTVTWNTPAAITYGTALGAAQLDATASVPGTFVYNPIAGTVLTGGAHTLGVTFTPTDTTDYQGSTGSTTIQVNTAAPTVTWANPAAINYGTALSATQLDATASVPGTFVYNPIAGTVLAAGTHTLGVTFTPTDTTDYSSATGSASIVVNQASTTITWNAPAAITYGTALSATQLDATASVPGTFVYNPAASTVLTAGAHTLSVTFTPTDATDYQGSTSSVSISVNQAAPTVTWNAPAAINYGTALSATQLNATASVPGTFAYNPPLATVLTAGTHILSVTFTPTDGVDYKVTPATVSITVNQAGSTVTWNPPAAITYGTALTATQLNATSSVPGTFAYNPASGTVLTAGTHLLSVTFTPTDNVDYKGSTATTNITVNQGTATITWGTPGAINYGTALSATQLNATASVPGVFTYNPALGTVLTAGSHQLSVTFAPTDGTDYATATSHVTILVNQATSTVTWSAPAAITYGTALSATQLDATSSLPGTFAYNPALGTVLTAGTHTLSVTFTPTDTTDYQGSTSSVTIKVNQATPAITWASPAAIAYGTPLGNAQLDATASTAGTFLYTPAAGTSLTAGSHALSVTFAPTDATDYTTATASTTLQVNQAIPVITWPSPGSMSYGTPLGATQLNATATPPGGTFTYNPPAGTTLPIGTETLSVSYVPIDTVDYATATATTSVNVIAGLTLSSIAPTSAPYGSAATTITLTGIGFTTNSVAQLNGAAISTTYVSPTQLTAQIPASFFKQLTAGTITVFDTVRNLTSTAATFSVTLPNVNVTFSGPSTASPGEQPTLNLVISQPYPIAIQGTMTLTVDPLTSGGPTDPAVQFSTGGTTLNFTIPAGSTTTPTVQIQTGTISSTITVDLTLEANGQPIESPNPVVINVPDAAPVITSATLTRSGNTLTVNIVGYSNTRDMSEATFNFTAAAGSSITDPEVSVNVASDFTTWYSSDTSTQFGSTFTYSQIFNLNNSSSTIGSVSVALTNSVGQSNKVTAQ